MRRVVGGHLVVEDEVAVADEALRHHGLYPYALQGRSTPTKLQLLGPAKVVPSALTALASNQGTLTSPMLVS